MIRRYLTAALDELLLTLAESSVVAGLILEVHAGRAREDALERALAKALADVKATESHRARQFAIHKGIYQRTADARDAATVRAEKAEAELAKQTELLTERADDRLAVIEVAFLKVSKGDIDVARFVLKSYLDKVNAEDGGPAARVAEALAALPLEKPTDPPVLAPDVLDAEPTAPAPVRPGAVRPKSRPRRFSKP